MALSGLGLELGAGQQAEVCIDSRVLGLMQRTLSLEEKVGQLFELLRDPVYLYLKAVVGNSAEAEDITQETFLRLYRTLHSGQPINNVRFWVFRVAHNLAFKERERGEHYQETDSRTWDELRRLLPDPGPNPEQRVLQMERLEQLHAAMAWLSPCVSSIPKTGQLLREHLRQKRGWHRIKEEDRPPRTPLSTNQLLTRSADP